MENFIALDLETTGFSPDTCEIIEIGAWKFKDGKTEKFNELVKPRVMVGYDIQTLTHITNEMLSDALTIEEVLPNFYDFCEDLPFLGHNLKFDYSFICRKGEIYGYDFTLNKKRTGIDTLQLSKTYLKNCNSYKLKDVADYFEINVKVKDENAYHRAWYDAYISKLIYDRFKYLYGDVMGVGTPLPIDGQGIDTSLGRINNNNVLSFT